MAMENQTTFTQSQITAETNLNLDLLDFNGLYAPVTPENEEAHKIINKAEKKKKKTLEQFNEGRNLCSDIMRNATYLTLGSSTVAIALATISIRMGLGPTRAVVFIFVAPLVIWLFICWMNTFKHMNLTYQNWPFLVDACTEARLVLEDIQRRAIPIGLKAKAHGVLDLPEVSEATLRRAKRNDRILLTYVVVIGGLGSFVGLVTTMMVAQWFS